jgi:hypothetical protein
MSERLISVSGERTFEQFGSKEEEAVLFKRSKKKK